MQVRKASVRGTEPGRTGHNPFARLVARLRSLLLMECVLVSTRTTVGHESLAITEDYTEIDAAKAAEIIGRVGYNRAVARDIERAEHCWPPLPLEHLQLDEYPEGSAWLVSNRFNSRLHLV